MKPVFNPFTTKLDWVANKASEIGITDTGTYYTGTEVETALQEIGLALTTFVTGPAGADTQVQFNDGGVFGADAHFTYNKTTDTLHVHAISGDATDGLIIEADNGTDIGILGAANTANVTWYGSHNFSTATQDTIAAFIGTGKTLSSLSTATYPSLTELSYLKGTTSAVQTQFDAKVPYTGATTDVNLGSHYLRADSGFGMGSAPTSVNYNYILKTTASVLASPTTLNITHTVTSATTGVATGMLILATQSSSTNTPSGMAGLYGFWTGSSGSSTGTVSGINFTARDSRTGSYTGTVMTGGTLTCQVGSTCNSAFNNAMYGGIYTLLDLSTGGAVPSVPNAASIVATNTFGNLSVSGAWRYFWALAGSGTNAAAVYGFEIGRMVNSTTSNASIQLDGTNETNNRIRWGTTNAPQLYRSANNTLTFDSSSGSCAVLSTGSFSAPTLISTIATGTAPLTVTSTTKVTNLNADLLDDQTGSYYLDSANFTGTNWTDLTDGGNTTLHTHDIYITKAAGYEDITATLTATAGEKISKQIPYGCTIVGWTITSADTSYTSGSASVKVNKCTYANYPTFSLISASDPLVITTSTKGTGSALTGWTTAITAGDFVEFEVDSATTITKVVVTLKVQRT